MLLLLAAGTWPASASAVAVNGGPMVGFATADRTAVWLMTDAPAEVKIEYWPRERPNAPARSAPVEASADTGNTARVDLAGLSPDTRYAYRVLLDGEPAADLPPLEFATPAANGTRPSDFVIATGSCAYLPDDPFEADPNAFGQGFEIYDRIAGVRPDLMLWLGDNIYYRDTDLEEDADARMNARWAATRSFPPLQNLLRTGRHLALWDDHDYGPNNSDRSFALKDLSLALFKRYWANASFGLSDVPGVFSRASIGDADLFLLDDRFYRDDDSASEPNRTMLGARQFQWLKDGLRRSTATFKLIANGSRMLTDRPSPDRRGGEGWHNFPEERQAFLDWLGAERIDGVFFVSGDIHYTHLTQRERPGTYTLTELTCSPLTSRVHPRPFPVNEVPGTLVTERNFCTLAFSGPPEARTLTVASWNTGGERLWSETFPAANLRGP